MRARLFVSVCLAGVAAVALVSASGAATKMSQPSRVDVSSRAAVIDYLRSIHVDPAGVVIQRGSRNYAGANCPGAGWSCATTRHLVVQIAPAGGRNTFSCARAHCAVVQVASAAQADNKAKCVKKSGLVQHCSITQSNSKGGDNTAVVYEKAAKTNAGMTQAANLKATITQQSTSGTNTACVYQEAVLKNTSKGKGHVTLTQEAHQSVTVKQDSTSGDNWAASSALSTGKCDVADSITQNQTLTASNKGHGTVVQKQNAANKGANVTIDIEQNQGAAHGVASGSNHASFVQNSTLTAIANSPKGPIRQTQSSINGGLLGTINQDAGNGSAADTTQNETQCEDAAKTGLTSCHQSDPDAAEAPSNLTQIQYGPVRKGLGASTQTRGGGADVFTIDQTSRQDNDQGPGSTQKEDVEGDCVTDGFCTIDQTVIVDGSQTNNFASGQDLDATITCTGTDCTTGGGGD